MEFLGLLLVSLFGNSSRVRSYRQRTHPSGTLHPCVNSWPVFLLSAAAATATAAAAAVVAAAAAAAAAAADSSCMDCQELCYWIVQVLIYIGANVSGGSHMLLAVCWHRSRVTDDHWMVSCVVF